jgi:hypothetical protein
MTVWLGGGCTTFPVDVGKVAVGLLVDLLVVLSLEEIGVIGGIGGGTYPPVPMGSVPSS